MTRDYSEQDIEPDLPALDEYVPGIAFDRVSSDEAAELVESVYHRPLPAGRTIPIDDLRSPAGELAATEARIEAQTEGDRYRALSRTTSFHGGA